MKESAIIGLPYQTGNGSAPSILLFSDVHSFLRGPIETTGH